MNRLVKITDKTGAHYDGKNHLAGSVVQMPEDVAASFVRAGRAEIVADRPSDGVAITNPLREVVDPLLPDADPLHSARLGSFQIEDHPGLVAHAEATGAPKRSGRMAPEATVVPEAIPDAKPAVKPAKG